MTTSSRFRRPGALGWLLIAICFVIGLYTGSGARPAAAGSADASYSGCHLLFVPIAFAFGFICVPLLSRVSDRHSSLDWSKYFWLFSGLAPLSFQTAAFASSVFRAAPEWGYLFNAACPLGVSLALAFRANPFEGDRNLL